MLFDELTTTFSKGRRYGLTRPNVRVRSGRYLIDVNAPTVTEAERLARVAVTLMGKPQRTRSA